MLCPNCQKWETLEVDLFCSWCRFKVADFDLSLEKDYFYVGDSSETINLTIRHTGAVGSIQLDQLLSDQPWVKIDTRDLADPILRSGRSITLPVNVEPPTDDDYHTAEIRISSAIGTRAASLQVVPTPSLVPFRGDYEIKLDRSGARKITGQLEIARGVVTVESLSTTVPEWAEVELLDGAALPYKLDARSSRRLGFALRVNEEHLIEDVRRSRREPPVEYSGNLVITYAELRTPREEPFYINAYLPPELVIQEEVSERINQEVFLGKRSDFVLTLQNGEPNDRGRAELQILGVETDAPWLRAAAASYPLAITSGRSQPLGFTILADEMSEGEHVARLVIRTNLSGGQQEKVVYVEALVGQMQDFDGALAIDFGTTNSCCATLNDDGTKSLIDIDRPEDNDKPSTAPSVILYHNLLDTNRKDYAIGNYAYQLSLDSTTAPYTVVQVKRRLGQSEPIPVSFLKNPTKRVRWLPREVTADIIQRIIERAEDQLKKRITRCTISHPSRFSVKQIDDLKAALAQCGIDQSQISTVHEPIGAALDFILKKKEVWKDFKEYHLMVFDFGGGTTDITLLHLTNHYHAENDLFKVRPKVLGANGNSYLGGEDVTEMAMKLMLERCDKVMSSQFPDAAKIEIPFEEKGFTDPRRRKFARDNWLRLWSVAEKSKIALSDAGEMGNMYTENLYNEPIILTVLVDGAVANNVLPIYLREVAPRVEELEERLKPKLEEVIEMMKRLARNNRIDAPDIILLSGKSSALPMVRPLIQEHFPETQIHTPDDLKECVAQGACLLSLDDPPSGVEFVTDMKTSSLSATTSRLGIRVNEAGQLRFKEFVDAGVPIPNDGLCGQVKGVGSLRRNHRIRILENTGLSNDLMIDGKENRNIKVLRAFSLEHKLAEWEREHNQPIPDEALSEAVIEYEVTPNLVVKLMAKIPGVEKALEFEAEAMGA